MLLMSGRMDPVGDYGKGVKKSADFFKKSGFNVSVKLYEDGRHEMLNEINRDAVFDDILIWLNDH
jgi:alpha-beta hydrolase superfamily lysophospholipase